MRTRSAHRPSRHAGPVLLAVLGAWSFALPGLAPADEFDDLRARWVAELNGGPALDTADPDVADELGDLASAAQSYWNSMDKGAARTSLWSDYAEMATMSSHITGSYNRLRSMATAYATAGCPLAGNTALRDDLFSALDWMYANRYNETKAEYYNWWDWQIGTPLALNDITALLYAELGTTRVTNYMKAVNKFTPTPTMTGANLVWKATVVAVRGVIVKDAAKIASARDSLGSVFAYVTSGDGFFTDGSFLQHTWHPYTGGYGSSLIANLGPLLWTLSGSTWQVTDARQANLFRWIHDSFQPVLYRGALMDMVRGREIARPGSGDHGTGHSVIGSVLRLARFAPPEDALAFKRMAKEWIQSDTSRGFIANAPLAVIPLAQAVLDDPALTPRGPLAASYVFAKMDRVVHFRPDFAFGISMSSSRVATYESINQENLRGWYSGDGMTYLYNGDLTQFNDNYWCTVNSYRLPGTTVDTVTRSNGSGQTTRPAQSWVGGASLGGFGVAGMQLAAWSNGLTGKKSWFLFDDEIVCLGADIRSTSGRTIESIVENRRLAGAGTNAFTANGAAQPVDLGWSATLAATSWAHLAGNVAGADIGYVFFRQPATVKAQRETRTGTWYDINNRNTNTTPYSRHYLSLWLDHGANPAGATYAYVLLPNRSSSATQAYATTPAITVVENSAGAQTVRESTLGLTAASFWADATHTSGGITASRKAAVIVRDQGNEIAIAVADPTQLNTGTIEIEWASGAEGLVSADPAITVVRLKPTLQIIANASGTGGRSLAATFTREPAPNQAPVAVPDTARAAAGTPTRIRVLANDSDPDGGPSPLALTSVGPPAHGSALAVGNEIAYTAPAGFAGVDSFSYWVGDGEDETSAAVTVTVGGSDTEVVAITASGWQDPNLPAQTRDSDLNTRWSQQGDGQWITYELPAPHRVGSVGVAFYNGNTRLAYFDVSASLDGANWTPLGNFTSNGTTNDLETFELPDTWARWFRLVGHGNSQGTWNSLTEVRIDVLPNALPLAPALAATTNELEPVEFHPLAVATDPDGGPGPLALAATGPATHGSVALEGEVIRYTPAAGFTGSDSFSYSVSDGGLTTTGLVTVEVVHPRTFAGFQGEHFTAAQLADPGTSGPEADPDRDRIRNFIEYALLLDPWKPESWAESVRSDPAGFSYTFRTRKLALDLAYVPEVSASLAGWDTAGPPVEQRVLAEDETTRTIEVRVPASAGPRFHRLRILRLP